MERWVKVGFPASCGELLQGMYQSKMFLSSYAINLYSTVTLEHCQEKQTHALLPKSKKLVELALASLNRTVDDLSYVRISVENPIPFEKGMGSSTADLTALLYAIYTYFGEEGNPAQFAQLATAIEPTDSLIYPDLTLMNPDSGERIWSMPASNDSIVCLELAQGLNTIEYRKFLAKFQDSRYEGLYYETLACFKRKAWDDVLALAQYSAQINQKYNPKPYFEDLLHLQSLQGIKGMNVSHTGSVIGLIYDQEKISFSEIKARVQQIDVMSTYQIHAYHMVSSAPRIEMSPSYQ